MKLALSEICSNRKCAVLDIKREETMELNFLDVSSPKGSLRYPIGINCFAFAFKRTYAYTDF